MTQHDAEARIASLAQALQGSESEFEQAAAELQALGERNPQDAFIQYLIGGAFDSCGRGATAIAYYERVFDLSVGQLPEARRPELFVQAGSTLRNLGRFEEARALFAKGIDQYPDYRALRVFAALNETSAGDHAAAARHLFAFALLRDDGSIDRFRRSLTWYIGALLKPAGDTDA